jgi:hypothetical protein
MGHAKAGEVLFVHEWLGLNGLVFTERISAGGHQQQGEEGGGAVHREVLKLGLPRGICPRHNLL